MRKIQFNKLLLIRLLLITITVIIGIGLGLWQTLPPNPPGLNSQYYPIYKKMLSNIEKFAVEPRPSGSTEIEKTRGQIIAEIEGMGLTPIIDEHVYTLSELADLMISKRDGVTPEEWWEEAGNFYQEIYGSDKINDVYDCFAMDWPFLVNEDGNINLRNILVKLESPGADSAILFVSHYDSVPESPGASDNMLGVCSGLEAMRSQANNTDLKTNIYFLFTDAEENGLLGAYAFITAYPKMKEKIDVVVSMDMGGVSGVVLSDRMSPKAYSLVQMVLKSGARPLLSSLAITVVETFNLSRGDIMAFLDSGYNAISLGATGEKEKNHGPTDTYENMNKATAWHSLQIVLALTDYSANNSLAKINDSSLESVYFPFFPGCNILMTAFSACILSVLACILALIWAMFLIKRRQFIFSFFVIIMCLLIILTITSTIFIISGSYLFSIPLLVMTITVFFNKWKTVYIAASIISGIIVFLLWTPVVYLVFEVIIKPLVI